MTSTTLTNSTDNDEVHTRGTYLPGIQIIQTVYIRNINTLTVHLLKEELPAPTQSEPEFKRWKYWSRMVAGWLFRQVDDDIPLAIYEQPDHPVEAFGLYKEILKQVQGNGRNLYAIPAIIKYEKLRRNDFTSAANFITEFEKQFNALRRMKVFISPISALVKVMHQIEGEVEKVRFIKEEIGQLTPDEITDNDGC